jgi:acetylornithine deacetylase/succinyl-diaminopimelate desuccinylase-like protein
LYIKGCLKDFKQPFSLLTNTIKFIMKIKYSKLLIKSFLTLSLFFIYFFGNAQLLSKEKIEKVTKEKIIESIYEFKDFLAIPNIGSSPEQVEDNLHWCKNTFETLGFQVEKLQTKGAPLLFAQKKYHKNSKTILFYLQIDGQPVDSTKWDQEHPFKPVLKKQIGLNEWKQISFDTLKNNFDDDWRIFARSASDSKGPAMAFISALEIFTKKEWKPNYNIKIIMDFQEELGSPHLAKAVENYKELLQADMLFIMDGTRHLSNLPTLTYGARGIATATLTIFGPKYPLHSGQYGNFAPNPIFNASQLIGGLKDESGRVTIPEFYDGIELTDQEKKIINNVPESIDSTKNSLGIAKTDAIGNTYQESLQYPSLNIRGLRAGWVGKEVRTIIPSEVIVEFDMRLVPESEGERQMQLLKKYIQDNGYHLVDSIPTDVERQKYTKLASFTYKLGSKPFRTEFDSPIGMMANNALKRIFGDKIVNMRTTGGSQPIAAFIKTLGVDAISIRIPNPDNNIHSPNENIRLGNFKEGIETCLAILSEPIK